MKGRGSGLAVALFVAAAVMAATTRTATAIAALRRPRLRRLPIPSTLGFATVALLAR